MAQGGSRQKRKRRQRSRTEPEAEPAAAPDAQQPAPAEPYARSRAKDDAARAALKPLGPGERPRAVTVGAVVALLFAGTNLIAYFAGVKVQGDRPAIAGIIVYSGLMLLVAWGMWKAKYWAVLGLETILGLIMVIFALLIVRAGSIGELLIAAAVLVSAGTLFWFLIKSLARIQMPERPGARKPDG